MIVTPWSKTHVLKGGCSAATTTKRENTFYGSSASISHPFWKMWDSRPLFFFFWKTDERVSRCHILTEKKEGRFSNKFLAPSIFLPPQKKDDAATTMYVPSFSLDYYTHQLRIQNSNAFFFRYSSFVLATSFAHNTESRIILSVFSSSALVVFLFSPF